MDNSLSNGRVDIDDLAAKLTLLYVERNYNLEKSSPENLAKVFKATFETINTQLRSK